MKLIYSILFFLFFSGTFIKAQSYSFTTYSIAEGLAQTQVKAITEDENGYLWIGTLGGLSNFNGSTFKNYSADDGLLNNRITSLFSNKNELWIGHQGGISLYKGRKFKSWSFGDENQNISVSKICYFQNKLLIATNGNGIYILEKNKLKHIFLKTDDENRIRGMETRKNRIYLATRAGLIVSKDLKVFHKIKNQFDLNLTGIVKKDQSLFVSTTNGKIYQYLEAKKAFKQKIDIQQDIYLDHFFIDSKWNIWSACMNGLIYKNPQKRAQIIDNNSGLPFNVLNYVYEDKNGTIWIGTDGKGLFRFGGTNFVYYNQNNGIQSNLITSSFEKNRNSYFFGSYENGLISFNNSTFKQYDFVKSTIWTIFQDKETNLFLGTGDGLIKTNLQKNQKLFARNDSLEQKISCFFKENDSKIYIGGSNGISLIYKGVFKNISKNYNATKIGTIRNIIRFQDKLICAADGGLFEFSNGEFKRYLGFGISSYSLKLDDFGQLWIGSESGLFCSNGKSLKEIYLSDQPASNFINFINYSKNQLFVGTNNGLYVLRNLEKREKSNRIHYGIEDGLVNLETNINSSLIDSQQNLWFGTAEGLVCFKTQQETFITNQNKPFLNISNIKINFQEVNYAEFSSSLTDEGLPLNLNLPPSKNNLLLELDGVLLKNYEELKYQYWLEGLDETWVPAFSSPLISLSNLPSGSYTLHIRAKNELGTFSDEYQLKFTVNPVFYKTWWFITLSILCGAFLIFYFVRVRINKEKAERYKENLEFKTKLLSLEQQSLNASMNRHFIFNSLNSIQYFINTQDKLSANKYLTNFAKLIRKNLDSSSENNNQVALNQEIERLELYLSLEAMRFKDRFDYVIETGDIDLEAIEVPAMLFQPFVENSIIHGVLPITDKKGLISIKLSIERNLNGDEKLIVSIQDNGVGIESSMAKKGNFGGDHKSQGMEITAKRINLLNKLSRQDFELEGPFQIYDENSLISGTMVLIKIPLKNLVD
ncbi:MAG: two-component regulator propeller domain-containing protein [Bacteroidota bacterium]